MPSRRRLIPWVAAGATAVALVAAMLLFAAAGDDHASALGGALMALVTFSSTGVGFVLATRRPANSIGWILLANGLYFALSGVVAGYAEYVILGGHDSLPGADWAVAFDDRTWPLVFVGVTAIAFVFPDGRVLADRRSAARLTAAAFAALLLAAIFSHDSFSAPFENVDNPIPSIPELVVFPLFIFGIVGSLAGMVLAVLALRARMRAANGIERLQMRWLSFAAACIPPVIVICLLEAAITGSDGPATFIALSFALTAVPVAIGIAVMRYRLYEIDRVVNRTLVYVAVTATLAATFAAVSLVAGVGVGGGSTLPTAAATLVVVLIFNPVRRRLQVAVDRRFNRARYEGLRRVEGFLSDLRSGKAAPEAAEATLAEALADPSLRLLYWISPEAPYVDSEGRPRTPDESPGRAATPVTRGSLRLGTVFHDAGIAEHPDLLDSVIEAAGLAIEIGRLRVEVRQRLAEVEESRARIVTAGIEERRRLERDLHDGAQQRLVSIGLDLRHVQNELGEEHGPAHTALDQVVSELAAAIRELRELARGIRPPALDDGLEAALEQLAARTPLPTAIDASPGALDDEVEAAAYFFASEALTNTVKHSGATKASVTALRDNGDLVVSVSDDGGGGASAGPGSGLEGIADRLAALGGRLTVTSPPGQGTTVSARLPCG
jgi:signal transduction histidine kinase